MSKELKTGIVSLLIIALGIWGFNFMKGQNLFSTNRTLFKAKYKNVEGLNEASLVTISGMPVGRVTQIYLEDSKNGNVIVEFTINKTVTFSKKSIAKMYSSGIMGGQNIAIIPNYEGEKAVSGDMLPSEKEQGLMSSVSSQLLPVQEKLTAVLTGADSLLVGMNQVLDKRAKASLNRSVIGLETTLSNVNKTLKSVSSLVEVSKGSIEASLKSTESITANFSKVSADLSKTEFSNTVSKLETTLNSLNTVVDNLNKGQGTLGKLLKDDKMYINLTNASKEMEVLLREMKLNPKRFVHFSLFGKKAKPYNQETNQQNISNIK